MTLIEGVGDEVLQFAIILLVVIITSIAWWSTNSRQDRYQSMPLMRSRPIHPVAVSVRTTRTSGQLSRVGNRVLPIQEMDSIVDADMAMLDNNRLHFYRLVEAPQSNQTSTETSSTETEAQPEVEPASEEQIREMDSIVSAMEEDVSVTHERSTSDDPTNKTDNTQSSSSNIDDDPASASVEETTSENANKIIIKLKYLNDTSKVVEASLDELLKDFKLRNFSVELSSARRVRLVFKGRLLSDDGATLRACGLHHHAVVHCLVHRARPPATGAPQSPQQQQNVQEPIGFTHELINEGLQPERSWDLENILMTLVSFALTVVWFFRCEYSNMFTASASVALFGLTVFYSVAIFGLYLSDTFHFNRRLAQPLPNN
ncbi:transmembrane and ubiquitin-like domain-containing protein 1 isoform X2 [Leptidea sinapis]|uniref:transmembrane and ubiquitin-like domain-containing protein 1 isoform X2 n=1 Tax=Leptidea sinapis TaxID=189913 RepID=UPI00212963F4|nr:transmembrane and ubiquitin-like domain-containing protein 1 isoform X2 [Leptidea sinapis]